MGTVYEYTNSRGITYYLHSRTMTLRGSGKTQTIYFFAKEVRNGAMSELPTGYTVKEVERTGLPVLKKA